MANILTATQLERLRRFWIRDLVDAGSSTYLSVYNRRKAAQFFSDAELQLIAAEEARRFASSIAEGGPAYNAAALVSALGAGMTQPQSAGEQLSVSTASSSDDGKALRVFGVRASLATVVSEERIVLSSSAPVLTTAANWQSVLAVRVPAGLVGEVTITGVTSGFTIHALDADDDEPGYVPAAGYGVNVWGVDLTLGVDEVSTAKVGVIGDSVDPETETSAVVTLSDDDEVSVPRLFDSIEALLVGAVAGTTTVSLIARNTGGYEAEVTLFKAIRASCFRAYLASDDYARFLEDNVTAVHKQWESVVSRAEQGALEPRAGRGGSVSVTR